MAGMDRSRWVMRSGVYGRVEIAGVVMGISMDVDGFAKDAGRSVRAEQPDVTDAIRSRYQAVKPSSSSSSSSNSGLENGSVEYVARGAGDALYQTLANCTQSSSEGAREARRRGGCEKRQGANRTLSVARRTFDLTWRGSCVTRELALPRDVRAPCIQAVISVLHNSSMGVYQVSGRKGCIHGIIYNVYTIYWMSRAWPLKPPVREQGPCSKLLDGSCLPTSTSIEYTSRRARALTALERMCLQTSVSTSSTPLCHVANTITVHSVIPRDQRLLFTYFTQQHIMLGGASLVSLLWAATPRDCVARTMTFESSLTFHFISSRKYTMTLSWVQRRSRVGPAGELQYKYLIKPAQAFLIPSSSSQTQERIIGIQSALALIKPSSPAIGRILYQTASSLPHPLFARCRWLGMSYVDYVYLAPTIWLASRILTCRLALHFFHAFLFGKMNGDQFKRVFLDHSQPLPPQEKARVERILTQLAELVTIIFTRMEKPCHDAQTRPNGSYRRDSSGTKSIIELPTSLLTEIDLAKLPPEALLRRWAIGAVSVVHECSHCLSNAVIGPDLELRFENDEFQELGFAFEQFVLGGVLQLDHKGTSRESLNLRTVPTHELHAVATNTPVIEELRSKVLTVIEGETLVRMFDQSRCKADLDLARPELHIHHVIFTSIGQVNFFLSKFGLKLTERPSVPEPNQRRLQATINTLREIGRFDRPDALNPDACTSISELLEAWVASHQNIVITRAHFINLEDAEYHLLKPAIILFEKLITSPQALKFWYTLLYNSRKKIKDIQNLSRLRIFPQSHPLSSKQTTRIHKRLKETSQHFITILSSQNNIELTGDGVTFTLRGTRSTLVIIAITFSALTLALSTNSLRELQKHYLRVALTLTHEFAHAFHLIHNPNDLEPFFNDDSFAELGFALLKFLLGGDAGYQISETPGFVVRRVGTHEVWEKYEKAGTPFAITEKLPRREQWRVSDEWVQRLFTERFWEEDVVRTEGLALVVGKKGEQISGSSLCQK
ncbi:uncharacterized protein MYCFIDRAFT_170670 [Pseudocercospora fijiensis CIRAD86]|uniref:Uncharacterized protein n=1 Tax=Pseudocercospora fijiensis (strain CIRAD86) TaxID=383855 RepID=N1QCD3_PSEFD|nr:uncharacterized protein MYCFIDRAFT_170670 [Pseudocercospora fijiensis CIRAD86]EME89162.1 hypothetical protein MYCFIDRAFT_170670 [Pseudocercospora fijiensis CIRAD86]